MRVIRFSSNETTGVRYAKEIVDAPGRLILVSGPSGVGKGSVIKGMFADPAIKASVDSVSSITTRAPRPGETLTGMAKVLDQVKALINRLYEVVYQLVTQKPPAKALLPRVEKQYAFKSEPEFLALKKQDQLFQWAHIDKHWYGSTVKEVVSKLQKGINVLFELKSEDALNIKKLYGEKVSTVFIAPPAPELETLKNRLVGRGTNSPESIAERLRLANEELKLKPQFDEVIVNEDNQLDKAIAQLKAIVTRKMETVRFAGFGKTHVA